MAHTTTNSIQTQGSSRVTRPPKEADSLPVLRKEVVHSLKAGKCPALDNIPSELLKNGSEGTTTVLTAVCQKDLGDEVMAKGVDIIAHYTFTEEEQPKAVSNLSCHQPNQPFQEDHAPSYPRLAQGLSLIHI